ncbi:hypothetical protein [Stenotrophomonas sp. SY1]|uniref:hypothetical protein n=1 Tax=Stenotrophomonas sp. SY1 TaxID=477235 RepID=UPI001E455642|nr:hypothetical protein [Stenotrophomonas sp. SY1]MCD9085688.1 hypothetical protein [Stenotrophomonas sp. SY1]
MVCGNEFEDQDTRLTLVDFSDELVRQKSEVSPTDIDIVETIARRFGAAEGQMVSLDVTVAQLINLCGEPEARFEGYFFPVYRWEFEDGDHSRSTLLIVDQGARRFSFCV